MGNEGGDLRGYCGSDEAEARTFALRKSAQSLLPEKGVIMASQRIEWPLHDAVICFCQLG